MQLSKKTDYISLTLMYNAIFEHLTYIPSFFMRFVIEFYHLIFFNSWIVKNLQILFEVTYLISSKKMLADFFNFYDNNHVIFLSYVAGMS